MTSNPGSPTPLFPPNLQGIALKLNRADHHLKQLQEWIDEFVESEFYSIESSLSRSGRVDMRVHDVSPTPPKWSVLIGEVAYNLRSALDHLVFELSALNSPDGKVSDSLARTSAFPIFSNGVKFRKKTKGGGPDRGSGLYKIRGVSPEARRAIDEYQPFHRRKHPENITLAMLDEISNIDKHRALHVTAAQMARSRYSVSGTGFRQLNALKVFPTPFAEGGLLARFNLETEDEADVTFEMEIISHVIFGRMAHGKAIQWLPVLDVLFACRNHVSQTVFPRLANLFPGVAIRVAQLPPDQTPPQPTPSPRTFSIEGPFARGS